MQFKTQTAVLLFVFLSPLEILGQDQSLVGEWEIAGRRCAGENDLIPLGDSQQRLIFRRGGGLTGKYLNIPGGDEMTLEEYREQVIADELERFEEDKERHEALCSKGDVFEGEEGSINLCESGPKKRFYKKLKEDYLQNAKDWIKENEERIGYDGSQDDSPCELTHTGSWRASNGVLTMTIREAARTSSCGKQDEGGGRSQTVSIPYYFEDGRLHFVLPRDEESEEYCGDSKYEGILFKIQ